MLRRIVVAIPITFLFAIVGLVFLAAHAPRTWAAHWTSPGAIAQDSGAQEYGAIPEPGGRWDLLWIDTSGRLLYSPDSRPGKSAAVQLDSGDVAQPDLIRAGRSVVGVWIHNTNGATELRGAVLAPASARRSFTLLSSSVPIEHPNLFAGPHGVIDLVFSWQKDGNFDVFLLTLSPASGRYTGLHRLTTSRYYSFYPRAVTDAAGDIDILHLESCCKQETWNVEYDRYNALGRRLQPTRILTTLNYGLTAPDAAQWGLDLVKDGSGNIWGAYTGVSGVWLFEANPRGQVVRAPIIVDPLAGAPDSLSLATTRNGGSAIWAQPYDLGEYLEMRPFDGQARGGSAERIEYIAGSEVNPHAAVFGNRLAVIWQTVSPNLGATFEVSKYRKAAAPSFAQRLGLGLGDPWEEAGLLALGTVSLAVIAASFNILVVLLLAAIGLALLYLLRRRPGRWLLYTGYLTLALFATFVSPGFPTLFLTPMPSLGYAAVPFGLLAAGGSLLVVSLAGQGFMRRIDDIYRAGIMAFLGVYFFAFLESAVFVQQHLGYT